MTSIASVQHYHENQLAKRGCETTMAWTLSLEERHMRTMSGALSHQCNRVFQYEFLVPKAPYRTGSCIHLPRCSFATTRWCSEGCRALSLWWQNHQSAHFQYRRRIATGDRNKNPVRCQTAKKEGGWVGRCVESGPPCLGTNTVHGALIS